MLLYLLLSLLLYVGYALRPSCSIEETMQNEGFCGCCYLDTEKNPTIGYGFNLVSDRAKSTAMLKTYGLQLDVVLSKCKDLTCPKQCWFTPLTKDQARKVFSDLEYPEAMRCATLFGSGHPQIVMAAIADMAMMGCGKLLKFPKFKAALAVPDYIAAAHEAEDSDWCRKLQSRCQRVKPCFLAAGCLPNLQACSMGSGIQSPCCEIALPDGSSSCCPSNYPNCVAGNCCPPGYPLKCGSEGCCPLNAPVCCEYGCCPSGSYCCGNNLCCANNEQNDIGVTSQPVSSIKIEPIFGSLD